MKYDELTVKAREVILDSQKLAGENGNPEIRPRHLLISLLTQKKGVVPNLIRHVGVDINQLKREVHALIDKLPKSNGSGKARTSGTFDQVIQQAKAFQKNWETLIYPVKFLFCRN